MEHFYSLSFTHRPLLVDLVVGLRVQKEIMVEIREEKLRVPIGLPEVAPGLPELRAIKRSKNTF